MLPARQRLVAQGRSDAADDADADSSEFSGSHDVEEKPGEAEGTGAAPGHDPEAWKVFGR